MSVRTRILERIRTALADRPALQLPDVPEPAEVAWEEAYQNFAQRLEGSGAEVVRFGSPQEARGWLSEFAKSFHRAWVSPRVPERLRPDLPEAEPEVAELGVSYAQAAVAETGSVVLASREGRRGQLLVPTQLVWVEAEVLYPSLLAALRAVKGEGGAALGLHSGPSKSADIGQITVKGVHGPGRLVVGVLAFARDTTDRSSAPRDPVQRHDGELKAFRDKLKKLALEGRTLETREGKAFSVRKLSETGKTVYLELGNGAKESLPTAYLEAAVSWVLTLHGRHQVGPSELGQAVASQLGLKSSVKASYLWGILHALGYV